MAVCRTEIAVIGAGVIGLAVAHRLAGAGREVVLVDPAEPGSGASYGNAGTVADYAVQPVGTPEVLRNLPKLLFDRSSPLAIRRAALPALAPWLWRFARQSGRAAARRNAGALAALLADAAPRWRDLASEIGGGDLLQDRGCIYWYQSDRALRAAKADLGFRRDLGVTVELLSGAELGRLEPGLPVGEGGGAYFPRALFMTDPGQMLARLTKAVIGRGVRVIAATAQNLRRGDGGVWVEGPGLSLHARKVILCAGAHSRALARAAGDFVPLETERGYHLEWDGHDGRLSRPVCPTALGFYLCPMQGRLRVAGTVELGGLTAPPSPQRLALLEAGARSVFADLPAPSRAWMGLRPSLPDSLPVLGPSRGGADVIHAFGHGHIGLTLAPITAALVEGCLDGTANAEMLAPLLARRF